MINLIIGLMVGLYIGGWIIFKCYPSSDPDTAERQSYKSNEQDDLII